MTDRFDEKLSRRSVLKGVALVVGIAAVPAMLHTRAAAAQAAKASKEAMKYQDHPNGDKRCDTCVQFIAGKTPDAMGTCKVVAGEISPSGYCIAWAPKP
jgi:hypothetical protein